ncbi:MAG: hypothetical protein WCB78_08275, partial [Pseudolabrys sp.]
HYQELDKVIFLLTCAPRGNKWNIEKGPATVSCSMSGLISESPTEISDHCFACRNGSSEGRAR